jgi:hypothetical protein
MNAQELADKFATKVCAASEELDKQKIIASDQSTVRGSDVQHCKRALEQHVIPFMEELKQHMGENQFSFSCQIDLHDHKPVGVSFRLGDGAQTSISTALGNIIVTRSGASGTSKGVPFVYPPDAEPYISNSGDLTREKMSKLVT